jgi:hypothetical protein
MQKIYNEKMIEHLKQLHEEYLKESGNTENDGLIQSAPNTEL